MIAEIEYESDAVRSVLKNILASPQFASSPQVSATLKYVVEETIGGRRDRIKAYSIAIDVLKKPLNLTLRRIQLSVFWPEDYERR